MMLQTRVEMKGPFVGDYYCAPSQFIGIIDDGLPLAR